MDITPKVKPILLDSNAVQTISRGTKTTIRSPIKPQPKHSLAYTYAGYGVGKWHYPSQAGVDVWGENYSLNGLTEEDKNRFWTPPYHADDVLYVMETWAYGYVDSSDAELSNEAWFEPLKLGENVLGLAQFFYKADMSPQTQKELGMKWHSATQMPREAARLFLQVTRVSVERVQDITDDGAVKEGADKLPCEEWVGERTERKAFADLWDKSLKPKDRDAYCWDTNPYVWVVEFKRCDRPEGWPQV